MKLSREFFIAGVQFHKLHTVINELEVDDTLTLTTEPTNKYDSNAVRIEFQGPMEATMCGYVPKKFSSEVSAALTLGKHLQCKITALNPGAKPWEKCKVLIEEVE